MSQSWNNYPGWGPATQPSTWAPSWSTAQNQNPPQPSPPNLPSRQTNNPMKNNGTRADWVEKNKPPAGKKYNKWCSNYRNNKCPFDEHQCWYLHRPPVGDLPFVDIETSGPVAPFKANFKTQTTNEAPNRIDLTFLENDTEIIKITQNKEYYRPLAIEHEYWSLFKNLLRLIDRNSTYKNEIMSAEYGMSKLKNFIEFLEYDGCETGMDETRLIGKTQEVIEYEKKIYEYEKIIARTNKLNNAENKDPSDQKSFGSPSQSSQDSFHLQKRPWSQMDSDKVNNEETQAKIRKIGDGLMQISLDQKNNQDQEKLGFDIGDPVPKEYSSLRGPYSIEIEDKYLLNNLDIKVLIAEIPMDAVQNCIDICKNIHEKLNEDTIPNERLQYLLTTHRIKANPAWSMPDCIVALSIVILSSIKKLSIPDKASRKAPKTTTIF